MFVVQAETWLQAVIYCPRRIPHGRSLAQMKDELVFRVLAEPG